MVERIKLILQAKNISVAQFTDEIKVQRSGMSHILSGRNKPSLDFVMKVLKRYPEINPSWFLFGEGEMYVSEVREKEQPTLFSADDERQNNEVSLRQNEDAKSKEDIMALSNDFSNNVADECKPCIQGQKTIERVIIFYTDKTCVEYKKE